MTGTQRRTTVALAAAVLAVILLTATLSWVTRPSGTEAPAPPSDARLAAEPARHDLTREQFYLFLPDRFANGDAANDRGGMTGGRARTGFDPTDKRFFQGGDLKGLMKRLDYIKGLGTTAIWMAPVFKNKPVQVRSGGEESAGYHGYWITDFTQVDPHFGTNEDLAELIDRAHAKGMKVFFDVITNHTADTIDFAEREYGYRSKGAYPYLNTEGRPFDDSEGMRKGGEGTRGVGPDSFPYIPQRSRDPQLTKVPAWLNDPTMYHNRGDSTFMGESALNGDFAGHDDLWTERPEVVDGLKRIYQRWVKDFDVDGFRVDTAKNVNMEFWTQWATALDAYAAEHGRADFFMFAEAFSSDPAITAPYVRQGRLDATLDFPFQAAVRNYASRGGPTGDLAGVFAQDYRYTTDRANAYEQVTFLGSHDMGRMGTFIGQDNPKATDAELLKRDRLAHELLFLSRGNPVIYSGDEQGFTGAGPDNDARQTLFASKVEDYRDDDQIGTDRTHAADAYDTGHPLYKAITALSKLTKAHPALRDGIQTERYADDGQGVYAFSRMDMQKKAREKARKKAGPTEYVVAVNNATEARTVDVPTESAGTEFTALYGTSDSAESGADNKITITVPALSSVVLKATGPAAPPATKPTIELTAPQAGATGDVEISADVDGGQVNRVVFAAQAGNGRWRTLGSADHAPYKVTQHLPDTVRAGTRLRYKAVVVDSAGRTASALAETTAGRSPEPKKPTVDRDYAVVHYQRTDGDYDGWQLKSGGTNADFIGRDAYGAFAWIKPGTATGDIRFTVEKDGRTDGPERTLDFTAAGEVWIKQGSDRVEQSRPSDAYPPQNEKKAVVHYHRPDGDYNGWGLHAWTGAANPPEWNDPIRPVRRDAFGLIFEVPLKERSDSLSYILHNKEDKDVPGDESLEFRLHGKEVWRIAGDPAYLTPSLSGAFGLDPGKSAATWIDERTVVWKGKGTGVASQQLVYAPKGGITIEGGALSDEGHWLRLTPTKLTSAQEKKHPRFAGYSAFTIDPRDLDRVDEARKGQLIATQRATDGALLGATRVRLLTDRQHPADP